MKQLVILLALILTGIHHLLAQQAPQDIDQLIRQSEVTRTQYGDMSDEYLSLLDSIAQNAFRQQKFDIALQYRNEHLDIVAKNEGQESLKYAIDLARLGNISFQAYAEKTQVALNYYLEAYNLFVKLKNDNHILYQATTYQLGRLYANLEQYDQALVYHEKYLHSVEQTDGAGSDYHLDACYVAMGIAATLKSDSLLNKYSNEILRHTSNLTNDNFRHYQMAIWAQHSLLWGRQQYQEAIQLRQRYLDRVKNYAGEYNDDYVAGLVDISKDYMVVGRYQESIDAALNAIQIVKTICKDDKSVMHQKDSYYDSCKILSTVYGAIANQQEEYKYSKELCDILRTIKKINSSEYYENLYMLFTTACSIGEYSYALSIAEEVEQLIPLYASSPDEDMYGFIGAMYDLTSKNGKYYEAIEYCKRGLDLIPKSYQEDDLLYEKALLYTALSQAHSLLGNSAEATLALSSAKSTVGSIKNQTHPDVQTLKAELSRIEGTIVESYEESIVQISQAIEYFTKREHELTILEASLPKPKGDQIRYADQTFDVLYELQDIQNKLAVAYANRGNLYTNIGQHELAHIDYREAAWFIERTKSKNSSEYITIQNNIATCEMALGRYVNAIKTLDDISTIIRQQYGEENILYALCLQNYGIYYKSVGDYNNLIRVSEQSKAILGKIYGENVPEYGGILCNLGMAYNWIGDYEKAEAYLTDAYAILSKMPDSKHNIQIAALLQNLGNLYYTQEKYQEIDPAYKEARDIVKNVTGENSREMANLLLGYGWICANLDIEQAIEVFAGALDICLNLELYSDPLATTSSTLYGAACLAFGQKPIPEYPQIALDILKVYYGNTMAFLTEQDRTRVWNSFQSNKNILFALKDDFEIGSVLYDYCLFSKSLLLTTSTNFGKAVKNSANDHILAQYAQLLEMKTQSDTTTSNQPAAEITLLERDIITQLQQDKGYLQDLNYTTGDVAKALDPNAVAIEFVDYTNPSTNQTKYVALILRKDWEEPQIISLFNQEEIEKYINQSPQVMYSNSTDVGKQLYKLIWEPISKYVHKGDAIYFSPAGSLYTFAIEALHTPTGEPLNKTYKMVRVTSTREVCKTSSLDSLHDAIIYGGLNYDVTPSRMAAVSRSTNRGEFPKVKFVNDISERAGWAYLEGTKKEADYIAELTKKSKIPHKLYSGDYGNEESFKALSGEKHSLIHIATHGFFMPNKQAKERSYISMFQNTELPGGAQPETIDPMLRSGLLLAGGNNVWMGNELQEGIEDGVLTAAEISAMDLIGTDIVVLSACDTGLGDISGDGVFGLQRAFKQAGVKTLIMSLWRVDDAATELMMTTFYKNLLSGKTKREAFAIAQKAVQESEDFSNPYYWGAFVMLD